MIVFKIYGMVDGMEYHCGTVFLPLYTASHPPQDVDYTTRWLHVPGGLATQVPRDVCCITSHHGLLYEYVADASVRWSLVKAEAVMKMVSLVKLSV